MDYRSIVLAIRRNFASDIEKRFKIGQLVDSALEGGANLGTLAVDTGVSGSTLDTFRKTWQFWGDERAEGASIWTHYSAVLHLPAKDARRVKARLLAGDDARDVYEELRAAVRGSIPRASGPPPDPWRKVTADIRVARAALEMTADQVDKLSDTARAELLAEADALMSLIKTTLRTRRRRAA